jgi:hypothetical protein
MTRLERASAIAAWILLVILAATLFIQPLLPRCEEDQVLVGYGDFEHGRWSAYACGPAVDDYEVTR